MLKTLLCILCFSSALLNSSHLDQKAQPVISPVPAWVKSYDIPLEGIEVKPSQVNLQNLLIDTQRNWEEKTIYRHYAIKVLTRGGIQNISQLQFNFDPSFSHIVVHTMRVYREEKWDDRLEKTRHNVIQRETDLEQNLYRGDLTLVYFLEDIREGDIVEYSYSVVGENPYFASHYVDVVYLQSECSVEKIIYRFLSHPDFSFAINSVNTLIQPKITDLSSSVREWVWEACETAPCRYEQGEPIWYNPFARVEMSQYKNWGEVTEKIRPVFTLPEDFSKTISLEMKDLVKKWKNSTKNPADRALLALRFVQDEVRYLGFEEGMGAFKPNDPSLTLERRFGDCKDKTFLLHALLKLMDISSQPLLVNSDKGRRIPDVLPMPHLFNHIVLQIEINGTAYFVDPTIRLQGGALSTNFFPDYEWGLLLSKKTKALTALPKTILKMPTEIDTSVIVESEESAIVKIRSTFYDLKAERMRRILERDGIEQFSKNELVHFQEEYGAVSLDSEMQVLDDRTKNSLILIESYRIPTQILSDKNSIELYSFILKGYLHDRINPDRTAPFAISYPVWVKERIHVQNPFHKWEESKEDFKQEHQSLFYSLKTEKKDSRAEFELELKHLQDHIPQPALREYWNIIRNIKRKTPDQIPISLATESDMKK